MNLKHHTYILNKLDEDKIRGGLSEDENDTEVFTAKYYNRDSKQLPDLVFRFNYIIENIDFFFFII